MATIQPPQATDRVRRSSRRLGALVLFIAASAIAASPALADDSAVCANSSGTEAINACSRVIATATITSKREDAYVNRGVEYFAMGKTDLALADYTAALKLDPKDAIAFNNRGNAYNAKGEYMRAIVEYGEAVRLNPQYTHAFFNRGYVNFTMKQYSRAIADFDQAIRIDPKYAKAFYNRGLAKQKMGNAQEGDFDIAVATHLQPGIGGGN